MDKAKKDEQAALKAAEELKKANAGTPAGPTPSPVPPPATPGDEEKVRANLARLGDEDRKLAEAQRYCPITGERLGGAMGVPVVVKVKDQSVLLCCKSCKNEAQADADGTLRKVQEQKDRAKVESHAHD